MRRAAVAIVVPVLRRPHRVRPLVESVIGATRQPWALYFVADPDDWAELAAVQTVGYSRLLTHAGNYAAKVNEAIRVTDEPLLFLGADDLDFHAGWLEAALTELAAGVGVVGTNDLCNPRTSGETPAQTHSTHSLVARWYIEEHGTIDEPGKALHDGYQHEFVDDEFVATAQARGMYAHASAAVVEHLHPMVGKAPMDDLYAAQRQRMRFGRRLYERRRQLWERLPCPR